MMTHPMARTPRRLTTALVACSLLLASSCVSQTRYEEATAEARYYQRLYQDLESFQGKLEAENELLEGELDLLRNSGGTIEASVSADIDRRLDELGRMAQSLGGAPGDVSVLSVEGGYGLRLRDSVLFDSGSSTVLPEGKALLARMGQEIASRPYQRIWVRGHTDSDPVKKAETLQRFPHGNLDLSVARAVEVAVLLTQEGGLEERRVVVAGFGPNDPVVPNDSLENKRRNRRVEIFVIEDEAAASGQR